MVIDIDQWVSTSHFYNLTGNNVHGNGGNYGIP